MPTTKHLEPSYALACENLSLFVASSNFLQPPIAPFLHFFSPETVFRESNVEGKKQNFKIGSYTQDLEPQDLEK